MNSDPHWGSTDRDQKARNILECLQLLTDLEPKNLSCVDIGCGSGGISLHLAPYFKHVCGVDPEPWQHWQEYMTQASNLSFQEESIESLSLADDSVDIVICNQVYEHVPCPETLIAQMFRILKPGGVCYFAGPNLLYPIEPHVYWPFIHWIPRRMALAILRVFAPNKVLDAHSTTYWRLNRWFKDFSVVDAVPTVVKLRAASSQSKFYWRPFRLVPLGVLKALSFLSPGFVFLLFKPIFAATSSVDRNDSEIDRQCQAREMRTPGPV